MNSYGSVSLVRQAIYTVLRHMNWFSEEEEDACPPPPPPSSITTHPT